MGTSKNEWRKVLSALIIIWCVIWTLVLGFLTFVLFVDCGEDLDDCEFDAVFSLGDASALSIWFVGFIGLSVVWFMLRSLEKDDA